MSLIDSFASHAASVSETALGERYLLGHPAQYVTVATGTVHLRKPGSRRTLCGHLINVDGPKGPRYHTDAAAFLTCARCGIIVEKAGDRWAKAKRAR